VPDERDRPDLAAALALLRAGLTEVVERRFLEPWSHDRCGVAGRIAISRVLGHMCREERTAARALQIAVRWAESEDGNQRTTAMLAFSGELGVVYPAEAASRLWQLMMRTGELCVGGFSALARLFAILTDRSGAADVVLTMLDAQRERHSPAGARLRMHRITVEAILAVLWAQSYRTARPAVAELLHIQPERVRVVARLWAAVLRSPRAGEDGLAALWRTLCALEQISGDAVQVAELGRALSALLSDDEHRRLESGLTRLVASLRHDNGSAAALIAVFAVAGAG
jgi:hypothetical protein